MNKVGEIEVQVPRSDLLNVLLKNRDAHKAIVKEAREGYVIKAREALERRLKDLAEGKIVSLDFNLTVPVDNTKAYNTVIGMLQMSAEQTITLSASEYRCLVEDNWGWKQQFLFANSQYSQLANSASSVSDD